MKETFHFYDHKYSENKISKIIGIGFALIFTSVLAFFAYSFFTEMDGDIDGITMVIAPAFFGFFLLPFLVIFMVIGKTKKTVVNPNSNQIEFYEGKKLLQSVSFSEIQSLEQSRYTYTVKSKNGSRTVLVFTIFSPHNKELVIAESTNLFKVRSYGEKIAKTLQVPLTDEKGDKREVHELDLPFHKRNHLNYDPFSPPRFPETSGLFWMQENGEAKITSIYNPSYLRILGFVFGVAIFFILNLAFGSMLELSVFYWESFPPSLAEIIFLVVTVFGGIFPILYVSFQLRRKKEIQFTSEKVLFRGKSIPYSEVESIHLESHSLYFVGDDSQLEVPLFFFCDHDMYETLSKACEFGILSQAKNIENHSSFTTEF